MPKIKGKIYKPRGFDSIKNTIGESWLRPVSRQVAARPLPAPVSKPVPGTRGGTALSCLFDLEVTAYARLTP